MPNVNTLLDEHVVLKCESIDRLFLNAWVAKLQEPDQLGWFLAQHRGEEIPRYQMLGEMTAAFMKAVHDLAVKKGIPVVQFERGQRKEVIAETYFTKAAETKREGVVLIGIAQERAKVFRPPSKNERIHGKFAPGRNSAFVKHVYFYIWDAEFGPSFIKFCSFAPWQVRVWLNAHQWLIRQFERSGRRVVPLDNGIAEVDDNVFLDKLGQRFGVAQIQRYFDRWIYRLPNPFTAKDRRAGYTYQLSILQLEIARTEVFDRPLHGRQFFEEVIRDNIDLGRPERIQVIWGRRILARRRGAPLTQTRVFTQNVDPSLQVSYRNTKVKQYWKCDRALRTETVINDTYDFQVGRKLENLPKLIEIGIAINRRLLELERETHRTTPAASEFENLVMPTGDPGRRAPGLRFGDPRVVALFGALSQFRSIFGDFFARDLRALVEHHLAQPYSMAQMAYDLRRLVRKRLLERIPHLNRYRLTELGRRLILFSARFYNHVVCPGLARIRSDHPDGDLPRAWHHLNRELDAFLAAA